MRLLLPLVFGCLVLEGHAAETAVSGPALPKRISIAASNDLGPIASRLKPGPGFALCGGVNEGADPELVKANEEGARIAAINAMNGIVNVLVIDAGQASFPPNDEATGFPLVVLTGATVTKRLTALVAGYNRQMGLEHLRRVRVGR